MRAIMDTLQDELRRPKYVSEIDPLEDFLRRNVEHREMEYLLTAIEQGGDYHVERLMRRISADGWRQFLASVNKRDTRAFFAYLA